MKTVCVKDLHMLQRFHHDIVSEHFEQFVSFQFIPPQSLDVAHNLGMNNLTNMEM